MCAEKRSAKMKRTMRRSVVGLVAAVVAAATGAFAEDAYIEGDGTPAIVTDY